MNSFSIKVLEVRVPKDQLPEMRENYTKLIGFIVLSVKNRLDPTFNISKAKDLKGAMLPYNFVSSPEDRKNDAKRKAYNDLAQIRDNELTHFAVQNEAHLYFDYCMQVGRGELNLLYPDQVAKSAEEVKLLHSTGLDDDTINVLLKP